MRITTSSGIYTITNLVNNKIYVGFATNIRARLQYHKDRLKSNIHDNTYLQNSFNKYGIENFAFEELELCSIEFLASQENYWGNLLNATNRQFGFNIQPFHPDGRQSQSRESIEKRKISMKGVKRGSPSIQAIKNMCIAQKGKTVSLETRKKLSIINKNKPVNWKTIFAMKQANTGKKRLVVRKNFKLSEEHKIKLRNNNKVKKVIQKSLDDKFIKEWISASEIKRELGFDNSQISKCCRNKSKQAYGYKWNY